MPPFITASLNKCSGTSLLPVLPRREQKAERAVLFSETLPEKAPFPFCARTAKQSSKTAQWRRNQKVAAPFCILTCCSCCAFAHGALLSRIRERYFRTTMPATTLSATVISISSIGQKVVYATTKATEPRVAIALRKR